MKCRQVVNGARCKGFACCHCLPPSTAYIHLVQDRTACVRSLLSSRDRHHHLPELLEGLLSLSVFNFLKSRQPWLIHSMYRPYLSRTNLVATGCQHMTTLHNNTVLTRGEHGSSESHRAYCGWNIPLSGSAAGRNGSRRGMSTGPPCCRCHSSKVQSQEQPSGIMTLRQPISNDDDNEAGAMA